MVQQIDIAIWKEQVKKNVLKPPQKHNTYDLFIWNYMHKKSTPICKLARGLVTDGQGTIIARSFTQFDKMVNLHTAKYTLHVKYDGSLILLFFYNGDWILSSRGSFESPHVKLAKEMLNTFDYSQLNTQLCYCMELIHPSNRIILDYGNKKCLVMLAAFYTDGREEWPTPIVKGVEQCRCVDYMPIKDVLVLNVIGEEGYVARTHDGTRYKIKFPSYLQYIYTPSTSYVMRLWKASRCRSRIVGDDNINEYDELETMYDNTMEEVLSMYEMIKDLPIVDFSAKAKQFKWPSVLFKLRKGIFFNKENRSLDVIEIVCKEFLKDE